MSGAAVRVQLSHKLEGLFAPRRYKVLYGGRGSGKTREVQRSIANSVHKLLCDQIARLKLGWFYTATEHEIRGANGSEFLFSGLLSHTVDSIKSFEGVDIIWIEEGQSRSKTLYANIHQSLQYLDLTGI